MSELLFPAAPTPTVAVEGLTARFPVRRIFCVGRNFADHAKEMGAEVDREAPFFFMKDALSIVPSGGSIPYPPGTSNFHHEMEFVVAIGAPAWQVPVERAMDVVFGYAAGLDMTRRDLQFEARAKQRPWDFGKNFEKAAVIGPIVPAAAFGEIGARRITLAVDGVTKQDGRLSDLVWSVAELISHLSRYYPLEPGDLIYTGTPAGVGPVTPGAVLTGAIDGLPPLTLTVAAPEAA
ncbi:MAG: fumarylacetoacetate hydrolase family protein [Phyllobacteriaceae bacterium]|nr:fumarylacetoacetate hydrolase family protein [Phyllobacteriaceae bacterium]